MRFELKPMSFAEVLDGSFKIFRNDLGLFLSIALVFNLPMTFVSASLRVAQQGLPPGKLPPGFLPLIFATIALATLSYGAMTAAAVQVITGQPVSLSQAVRRFLGVLGPTIWASIMITFIGFLCLMALIIPGLIYFLRRWLYLPVLLVEGGSATNSLKRSKQLVGGVRGGRMDRMFGIGVVFTAVSWAAIWGTAMLIPAGLKTTFVGAVLGLLPQVILSPLLPIALVLTYFDARIRDEGYDLELRAQAAGAGTAAGAA